MLLLSTAVRVCPTKRKYALYQELMRQPYWALALTTVSLVGGNRFSRIESATAADRPIVQSMHAAALASAPRLNLT